MDTLQLIGGIAAVVVALIYPPLGYLIVRILSNDKNIAVLNVQVTSIGGQVERCEGKLMGALEKALERE